MNYSYKTHSKRILGDLHTPVSIYLKVRDMYPESALLESSDFHANENSLSFIALCPIASIGINSGMSTMRYPDNHTEELFDIGCHFLLVAVCCSTPGIFFTIVVVHVVVDPVIF